MNRLLFVFASLSSSLFAAELTLVHEHLPKAEIIIAEKPPRMAKLAAQELQTYVEKITGARLPVVTVPSKSGSIPIYVGRSSYTEALKITDEGLLHGAFRIVANEKSVVLLGRDHDYVPREPWPHSAKDFPRVLKDWDKLTGETWGFDMNLMQLYKQHNEELDIWEQDERGSLNAVYEVLRGLGVRWYLPGELGEFVPKTADIVLPQDDKTVKPDFPLRYAYQYGKRFSGKPEEALWQLRLGVNQAPDLIGPGYVAHGSVNVHSREEVMKAHPEYYTLAHGVRDMKERGKPCLSSPGLLAQNVKYVRAMFDILDVPVVSVMPADGYTVMCECELCKGKETPERGGFGRFSDYSWGYVNEVAKEVLKTHPNRKIICLAYGASLLPPAKIDKLSPNIIVCIAQTRSIFHEKERGEWNRDLRRDWLKKLPAGSQLCLYEYYLHPKPEHAFAYVPAYFPHLIADDLRSLKGVSMGDYIEIYRGKDLDAFGINALNVYVTARMWWDSSLDVDALIDEYCASMYGPAREEMKACIAYCEANWMNMLKSPEAITQIFALLDKAQKKVATGSPEAKRIDLISSYVQPLMMRRDQILRGADREDARSVRISDRDGSKIKIDGAMDEEIWGKLSGYQRGDMVDCATTASPGSKAKTAIGIFWHNESMYIGIRCMEKDTKSLKSTGTRSDDPHILDGDYVQVLLETQTHSFYQIAVNPAGLVLDVDHQGGAKPEWSANAQIAAHVGEKEWSVEIRLPVGGDLQAAVDALNGVSGRKPAASYPWFFNVCRQRISAGATERYAFVPTQDPTFLDPAKFGRITGYVRRQDAWNAEKEKLKAAEAAEKK